MIESFDELPLSENILQALQEMGIETPSPIQAQAIPVVLEGKDVIGQAQTGTGKTAAFAIPSIQLIDSKSTQLQVLVLCPTRELANQVAGEFKKLLKYTKGVYVLPIYGGESIERQISALKRGVQIVIGTPGRVIDHIQRKTLKLGQVKMMVLDEADEMLNMGFREDIELILSHIPAEHQTMLFSATMAKPILEIAKSHMEDPEIIKITKKELTTESIEQYYYEVKQNLKTEVATQIIDQYDLKLMLVFCNTKKKVDEVVDEFRSYNYNAIGIHGDLKQRQRTEVMAQFRKGTANILVATDVAARGIDVKNVDAVINYDLPMDLENYVHRIGRTGRAGQTGKSFSLVTKKDFGSLRQIESFTKVTIQKGLLPEGADLINLRENKFLSKIKNVMEKGKLDKFYEIIERYNEEGFTTKELAAAMLKLHIGEVEKEKEREERGERRSRTGEGEARIFVNVGKKDKVRKGDILGAVAGETGIDGSMIGSIDVLDSYSFFNVPLDIAEEVIEKMKNRSIKGKKVNLEISGDGKSGGGNRERGERSSGGYGKRREGGGGYGGKKEGGYGKKEGGYGAKKEGGYAGKKDGGYGKKEGGGYGKKNDNKSGGGDYKKRRVREY